MSVASRAFFIASLVTFAAPCWSNNFYLGLGAGPDTGSFDQKASIRGLSLNITDKQQNAARGTFISLFGGYAWYYKQAYLAAELNLNGSSMAFESYNNERFNRSFSKTIYKIPANFGISLLPGYQLTNIILLYGRAGFVKGHFIVDTSDTSLENINSWLYGFRYGLGAQAIITAHWLARLEWNRINYQTQALHFADSSVTKNTRITPVTNQFEFGVVYDFN